MTTPELVTTRGGVIHRADADCLRADAERWPWNPRNDGPGVARACRRCLANGLPEGDA